MSELRQDLATQSWVIVARERAKRPHDFVLARPKQEPRVRDPDCPFCPGNEDLAGVELCAYRESGPPNGPGWLVRTVPNKFPALEPESPLKLDSPCGYTSISGFGYHEVVILTPRHDLKLATMSLQEVELALKCIRKRMDALAADSRVGYLAIFHNHGPQAGSSLIHPHSQIIACPIVPTKVRQEIEEARRYYDGHVECVYCHILEQELEIGERIVLETPQYVVLAPYASRVPFELLILPRGHHASFVATDRTLHIHDLAEVISRCSRLLREAVADPDFNIVLHTAPLRDSCSDYYHWHLEILPRVVQQAGFELGTGINITNAIPEETAEFLRGELARLTL